MALFVLGIASAYTQDTQEQLISALKNADQKDRAFSALKWIVEFERLETKSLEGASKAQELLGYLNQQCQDPKVLEAALKLSKELEEQQAEQLKQRKEETANIIRLSLNQALEAAKASDLDEIIQKLQLVQKSANLMRDSDPIVDRGIITAANQLLLLLQEAFLTREQHQEDPTQEWFNSKTQSVETFATELAGIFPRSELIVKAHSMLDNLFPKRRLGKISQDQFILMMREATSEVKNLKEFQLVIMKGIEHVERLTDVHLAIVSTLRTTLQSLLKSTENLESGQPVSIMLHATTDAFLPLFTELNQVLMRFALPRIFGVSNALKIQDGEGINAYYARLLDFAKENENWMLLDKAIDLAPNFGVGSLVAAEDQLAVSQFISALNFEKVSRPTAAVTRCLQVLARGTETVPVASINAVLDRIKAQHPDEYASAVAAYDAALVSGSGLAPGSTSTRIISTPNGVNNQIFRTSGELLGPNFMRESKPNQLNYPPGDDDDYDSKVGQLRLPEDPDKLKKQEQDSKTDQSAKKPDSGTPTSR